MIIRLFCGYSCLCLHAFISQSKIFSSIKHKDRTYEEDNRKNQPCEDQNQHPLFSGHDALQNSCGFPLSCLYHNWMMLDHCALDLPQVLSLKEVGQQMPVFATCWKI